MRLACRGEEDATGGNYGGAGTVTAAVHAVLITFRGTVIVGLHHGIVMARGARYVHRPPGIIAGGLQHRHALPAYGDRRDTLHDDQTDTGRSQYSQNQCDYQ